MIAGHEDREPGQHVVRLLRQLISDVDDGLSKIVNQEILLEGRDEQDWSVSWAGLFPGEGRAASSQVQQALQIMAVRG